MYDFGYVDITPQVGGYVGDNTPEPGYIGSGGTPISPGGLNLGSLFSGLGNLGRVITGQPVVSPVALPAGSTGTLVAPQSALSNPSLPMILIIGVIIMLMFSKGSK